MTCWVESPIAFVVAPCSHCARLCTPSCICARGICLNLSIRIIYQNTRVNVYKILWFLSASFSILFIFILYKIERTRLPTDFVVHTGAGLFFFWQENRLTFLIFVLFLKTNKYVKCTCEWRLAIWLWLCMIIYCIVRSCGERYDIS